MLKPIIQMMKGHTQLSQLNSWHLDSYELFHYQQVHENDHSAPMTAQMAHFRRTTITIDITSGKKRDLWREMLMLFSKGLIMCTHFWETLGGREVKAIVQSMGSQNSYLSFM